MFQSFPPISVVSAVVSTVRLASTALVALYPKECLELLAVLSLCASLFGVCSDFYVNIAPEYQGYYVFAASIFIFFCSGSSIARALIVTEDSRGKSISLFFKQHFKSALGGNLSEGYEILRGLRKNNTRTCQQTKTYIFPKFAIIDYREKRNSRTHRLGKSGLLFTDWA